MKKRKFGKFLVGALVAAAVAVPAAACTPTSSGNKDDGQKPVTISVDSTEFTLEEGGSRQILASVSADTEGAIAWTSSAPSVATVESGLITALSAGEAEILVSAVVNGETISKTIVVTVTAIPTFTAKVNGVDYSVKRGGLIPAEAFTATKESDVRYDYTLAGWQVKDTGVRWDPATSKVRSAVEIEPIFNGVTRFYKVTMGDEERSAAYGSLLAEPLTPTKARTAEHTYKFAGWYVAGTDVKWNFETDTVQGETVLEARFTERAREYSVSFLTDDGTLLDKTSVEYGKAAVAPAIPSRKGYTASWDKEFDNITEDTVVTAKYDKIYYAASVGLKGKSIVFRRNSYESVPFTAEELASATVKLSKDGEEYETTLDNGLFVASGLVEGDYAVEATFGGKTYEGEVSLNYADGETVVEINRSDLGGTYHGRESFPHNSKTYVSGGEAWISYYDYTYQTETEGSRYYIETDAEFVYDDGVTSGQSNFAGIMAACWDGDLSGAGREKLIIGVNGSGTLGYTTKGSWSTGNFTAIKDVNDLLGGESKFKIAVYRNDSEYSIFINDKFVSTIAVGMFGESGFGLGSQGNNLGIGVNKFSNFVYSFNEDLLDALEENVKSGYVWVDLETATDVYTTSDGEKIYMQDIDPLWNITRSIKVDILNQSGDVVKTLDTASRHNRIRLLKGYYTVRATFTGCTGTTKTVDTSINVRNDGDKLKYNLVVTDVAGAFTLPGGTTINSFGSNYVLSAPDSLSLTRESYAFIDQTASNIAYIEGTFKRGADGWVGFIMNISDKQPRDGGHKVVFAVYNGGQFYYQASTVHSWNSGTGDGVIGISDSTYKMGVARINDSYYVYINGTLFRKYTITSLDSANAAMPADNVSGFGIFRGSNYGGTANFVSDIKYTTDENIVADIVGANKVHYTSDDAGFYLGENAIEEGGNIFSGGETLVKVNVPEGKQIASLTVKVGDTVQNVSYKSENTFAFYPVGRGDATVEVEFEDSQAATLSLSYGSAQVEGADGEKLDLYDLGTVDPSQVQVTVRNVYTGKVDTFAMGSATRTVEDLTNGTYEISFKYADNVTTRTVVLQEGANEFKGELSLAYLGGSISIIKRADGSSYVVKSYKVNDTETAGGAWTLVDGQRNKIKITGYTFALQRDAVSAKAYVEGVFDLDAQKAPSISVNENFFGLLIAHGADELADTQEYSYKLGAAVRGDAVVVTDLSNGWGAANTAIVANIKDLGIVTDRSRVKLGVARDGNKFWFYVNGVYVGSFVTDNENFTDTYPSGVGIAGAGNVTCTIDEFNYSTSSALVDALKREEDLGEIDIYVIAGQSNASGYTSFNPDVLADINPNYIYGYNNIYYVGNARRSNGGAAVQNRVNLGLARAGLGSGVKNMAAEVGMAEKLSSYYNKESGRAMGFIRYAAGGTCLLNGLGGENASEGNWVPPSYQEMIGGGSELTGGLYRNLMKELAADLKLYKAMGYTPVIRGMWWMQGENDRGNPTEYVKAFKCFASDIRKDFTALSGADCSEMPIIVGEISRTTGNANPDTVTMNKKFIAMQQSLPDEVDNVYVCHMGDFDVNNWVNGANVAVGTDSWHYNWQDHLTIGNMVGDIILRDILKQ